MIPVAVAVAVAVSVANLVRPRLVVDAGGVTVTSTWTSRRYLWQELAGWFVVDQRGWCRIALVPLRAPVAVSALPLDTRTPAGTDQDAGIPPRLAAVTDALEEGFAGAGITCAEPTPEETEEARRATYRLVWTSLAVPANLLGAVIVVSILLNL